MSSLVFKSGTVVPSSWLNDVNSAIYNGTFPAGVEIPASSVSFDQTTAYAQGTIGLAMKQMVNVASAPFNAVLDGTTDIISAINAALATMTQGTLVIPGNARISSPIMMKSNVDVICYGTLDATACTSAFNWTGTSVLTTALTVQANEFDTTVTVADSTGISIGDYVVLENNEFHSFPGGPYPGIDSVFSEVIGVAGNVLTLNNMVPTTFPVVSSQIRKIIPVMNAKAMAKKIIGSPTNAFYLQWAFNNEFGWAEVNPVNKNAVLFFSAFGNRTKSIYVVNTTSNVSPGYGYGVLFDFGSSDNDVDGLICMNTRENSTGFSPRRNSIRNFVCFNPYDSGVNTHGLGAVDTLFENGYIINAQQYGMAVGQAAGSGWWPDVRTKIKNVTVFGAKQFGVREQQYDAALSTDCEYEDITLIHVGSADTANFNHGFAVLGTSTSTSIVNPRITNLKVQGTGPTGGIGLYITGLSAQNTIVNGVDIDTTGGAGIRYDGAGQNHSLDNAKVSNAGERGIQSDGKSRILLGNNVDVISSTLSKFSGIGDAAPTNGTWIAGDFVPNKISSAGADASGWICTAAPHTFELVPQATLVNSWTPSPTSLTVVGTPTYTGTYVKIGNVVYCTLNVASTTTTASTAGTTYFTGLPFAPSSPSTCSAASNATLANYGNGIVSTTSNGQLYTPTWSANADVIVSFFYFTAS